MMDRNCQKGMKAGLVCVSVLLSGVGVLMPLSSMGDAAVTTNITSDGTLLTPTSVTKNSNLYNINGGTIRGSNLFHSFGLFSVGTGDIASFNGPGGIVNILSRVTAGSQSSIDGQLRSTIAGANLYLMNPAGVLFGPNATLNLSGSFHVTTGDYLRLTDNVRFTAAPGPQDALLTTAPVAAFGFVNNTPAVISVQGSTLKVPNNKTLSMVGGDFTMTAGMLSAPSGRINVASVAPAGEALMTKPDGTPDLNVDSFTTLGAINVSQSARLDVSGNPGGTVVIRGGQFALDNSQVLASTSGTANGAPVGVDLQVSGDVSLSNAAAISTSTLGAGRGGDIQIRASQVTLDDGAVVTAVTSGSGKAGSVGLDIDNLTLTNGAGIEASTTGAGKAGDIRINATNDVTISGLSPDGQTRSGLRAKTQTAGLSGGGGGGGGGSGGGGGNAAGAAGDIVINAKNLTLNGGAQIDSSTVSGGAGGLVSITATETITIAGTSTRLDSDSTRGNGNGGNVHLQAKDIVLRDGAFVSANSAGTADAGSIDLTAQNTLTLENGGTISTSTAGSGKGGTITVRADQVLMDGTRSSITADTLQPFADLTVTLSIQHSNDSDLTVQLDSPDGSRVALFSRVGGNGTNFINTKLDDSALKSITSGTAPFTGTFTPREPLAQLFGEHASGVWTLNIRDTVPGNAGSLQNWSLRLGTQVFQSSEAPKTILDNGSIQSSLVVNAGSLLVKGTGDSKGQGGDITLNVRSLSLQNGATVSATSRGLGGGGTVQVNASEGVIISGANTGLSTNAESKGVGGDITVKTGQVELTRGALISANSSGTGNAGNIRITAADLFVMRDSTVTTQAAGADGGNIDIRAGNRVQLVDSSITTSVGTGAGNGGNISIDPQLFIVDHSRIVAQAFGGRGGNINIAAGVLLVSPDSVIDASSSLGVNGTVSIQSPVQNLSGTLSPLPSTLLKISPLSSHCGARAQGGSRSSFTVAGRDGVPAEPGGLLPSPISEAGEGGMAGPAPGNGVLVALNLARETLDGECTQ